MSLEVPETKLAREVSVQGRLESIFNTILSYPPAANERTASEQIIKAFNAVELALVSSGKIAKPMAALPLMQERHIDTNYGKLYFDDRYFAHVVFISENGAIDIRRRNERGMFNFSPLRANPLLPRDSMVLEFEKPGSDGKTVWEAIS